MGDTVTPLTADDIRWTPFVDDEIAIRANHTDDYLLLVLDDDEVRAEYRQLRCDMRAVRATLHAAVGTIAVVTVQRDRLREQNRQSREPEALV